MHIFTETTTSDESWAVSWTKSVRSILQFPNILLDGWEGLKAYTFEKGSLKVHTLNKISAALRAAKLLSFKFSRRSAARPSSLQICFLRLCKGSFHVKSTQKIPYPHRLELVFYTVSVEILTHSEFQRSAMYGFRVRTRQKIDFSEIFCLPIVTKSTITLSEITFMTYNLHHL